MAVTVKVTGNPGIAIKAQHKEFTPALARGLLTAAQYAGGVLAETVTLTFQAGTAALARSFPLGVGFVDTPRGVAAGALSDLEYAAIQDDGGIIEPKTAKMLAVPLTPAAKKLWPRQWPQEALSLVKMPSGNLLLIPKGGVPRDALYVLKEQVTIKGRGYVEKARKKAEPEVQKIVDEAIAEAMDKGAKAKR